MTEQKKQRRKFWVIVVIVFLGFIGISMPYLIFPALFLNPHYAILPASWGPSSHALFLGITLAAYPLGQFVGSPILGTLSDEYGRKQLLSASLLIAAGCYLLTGFAIAWKHLGLLIVSRFMAGIMEGNIAVARAMAADIKTISKHETFGKINAAISFAYLLGPLLGGLLSDKNLLESLTASTPFYFICVLFLCLAGLSALVLDKSVVSPTTVVRTFWQRINFIQRMSTLFSNKQLKFLLLISTAFTLAVDIFYEFGPVYLTVKWTLGPAQLIFYNAALCIGLVVGNGWLSAYLSSRVLNRLAILCSIGGFCLFLIGTVLVNSPWQMVLCFTLCGLVIGLAVTLLTVKISDTAADTIQGEVLGVQLSLRVLGDAIICLFGSVLLLLSPKLILIVASAMTSAVLVYYSARCVK
ncbi:MAG TPA: MFS transporter [Rhabdochlamydiaceae bacterium]|nr:MFS transporter [Rhabdochlamydiaceae bacterium]